MFGFGKFSRQEFEGDILGSERRIMKKKWVNSPISPKIYSVQTTQK